MQYLYNFFIVFFAFLISYFVRPFFGAYANKKGENLATKEDIAQLTKIAEGIRAKISDEVWDRQKQWELKRDAVLDAIRAHADLEYALVNLNSLLSTSKESITDKTNAELSAAALNFRSSRYSFRRAHLIADLAVGGQFSNDMSAYFLLTGTVSKDMTSQKSLLDRAKMEKLALAGKDVILSARQALGIKDAGDLPRFDESN
jgi:hypothetical protein